MPLWIQAKWEAPRAQSPALYLVAHCCPKVGSTFCHLPMLRTAAQCHRNLTPGHLSVKEGRCVAKRRKGKLQGVASLCRGSPCPEPSTTKWKMWPCLYTDAWHLVTMQTVSQRKSTNTGLFPSSLSWEMISVTRLHPQRPICSSHSKKDNSDFSPLCAFFVMWGRACMEPLLSYGSSILRPRLDRLH